MRCPACETDYQYEGGNCFECGAEIPSALWVPLPGDRYLPVDEFMNQPAAARVEDAVEHGLIPMSE